MGKKCIVVLGMHRSGTSALAGVLSRLGIYPGDALLPAMEGINPKGFWEHAEIVPIHNQLLEALGSSWEDVAPLPDQWWLASHVAPLRERIISVLRRDFDNHAFWLIKDPRMCRLLPLWHEVFSELGYQPLYILTLRNPAEVANSLHKRDDLTEEESCLLWLTHTLEAEYQTRGQPRAFVNYEHLLSDWRRAMTGISHAINFAWPVSIDDAATNVDAFLDPALRHHDDNANLPDHPACNMAQEGFDLLSDSLLDRAKLDRLRGQTGELVKLVRPWSNHLRAIERKCRDLRAAVAQLESEKAALEAEISRIKSTVSWQITKPARAIWNVTCSLLPNHAVTRDREKDA